MNETMAIHSPKRAQEFGAEDANLHTALTRCDHAVENLTDKVTELCTQIAPVLRPESPTAPTEVRAPESQGSDVRQYVERITRQISELSARLGDVRSRVDV